MGALSDTGAALALDAMLGSGHAAGFPATVYLALSTTDPVTALTEPVGGAYARKAVVNNSTNWPAAVARQKALAVAATFAAATADWGVITHFAICSAATAGTVLASDTLTTAQSVLSGDTVTIPAGGLVLSA